METFIFIFMAQLQNNTYNIISYYYASGNIILKDIWSGRWIC